MALMIPHLLGLFYFMSNRLSVCGTHIFPCNGPESPFLDTDKVYLIIHFCWNAFDFDILSLLISFLLLLSKSSDIKQSNFSLFFLMCTYHLLSDIIGFKDGSPFFMVYACIFVSIFLIYKSQCLSFFIHGLFIYFFFPNWRRFPPLSFLKKYIPQSDFFVCFLSDRVQDSYEEHEFWMTILDWVGIRLNKFEMFEEHENCLSRWKQCWSRWKHCWMKPMYK